MLALSPSIGAGWRRFSIFIALLREISQAKTPVFLIVSVDKPFSVCPTGESCASAAYPTSFDTPPGLHACTGLQARDAVGWDAIL